MLASACTDCLVITHAEMLPGAPRLSRQAAPPSGERAAHPPQLAATAVMAATRHTAAAAVMEAEALASGHLLQWLPQVGNNLGPAFHM